MTKTKKRLKVSDNNEDVYSSSDMSSIDSSGSEYVQNYSESKSRMGSSKSLDRSPSPPRRITRSASRLSVIVAMPTDPKTNTNVSRIVATGSSNVRSNEESAKESEEKKKIKTKEFHRKEESEEVISRMRLRSVERTPSRRTILTRSASIPSKKLTSDSIPETTTRSARRDLTRNLRSASVATRRYEKELNGSDSDDDERTNTKEPSRSSSRTTKIIEKNTDDTKKKSHSNDTLTSTSSSITSRSKKNLKKNGKDGENGDVNENDFCRLDVHNEVERLRRIRKNPSNVEFYGYQSNEYTKILKTETFSRGGDPDIPDVTTSLAHFFCPLCNGFYLDRYEHLASHLMTGKESGVHKEKYEKLLKELNHNIDAREKNEIEWFRRSRIQSKQHWEELLNGLTNRKKKAVIENLETIGIVFTPFNNDYEDLLKPAPLWSTSIPDNDDMVKELAANDGPRRLNFPGDIGDISKDPQDSYIFSGLGRTPKEEADVVRKSGLNRMLDMTKHPLLKEMYDYILGKLERRHMENKMVKSPRQLTSLIIHSASKILLVALRKNGQLGNVILVNLQQLDPKDLLDALNNYTEKHLQIYKKGTALNFLKGMNAFLEYYTMADASLEIDETWLRALNALKNLNKRHQKYAHKLASSYNADARANRAKWTYSEIWKKTTGIRDWLCKLVKTIEKGHSVSKEEFSAYTYFLIILVVTENGQRVEFGKKLLVSDYEKVKEGLKVKIHDVKPYLFPFTNSKTQRSNLFVAVHPETKSFLDVYQKTRIKYEREFKEEKFEKNIRASRPFFFISSEFGRPNNVMDNVRRYQEKLGMARMSHGSIEIRNAVANTSAKLLLYEDPNNLDPRVFPAMSNMNHSAKLHFHTYATDPSHIFQSGWIHLQKAALEKEPLKELLPKEIAKELKVEKQDKPYRRTEMIDVEERDSDDEDGVEDEDDDDDDECLGLEEEDLDILNDPTTSGSSTSTENSSQKKNVKKEKPKNSTIAKKKEGKEEQSRRRGEPRALPSTPRGDSAVREGTEGEPLALSRSDVTDSMKKNTMTKKKNTMTKNTVRKELENTTTFDENRLNTEEMEIEHSEEHLEQTWTQKKEKRNIVSKKYNAIEFMEDEDSSDFTRESLPSTSGLSWTRSVEKGEETTSSWNREFDSKKKEKKLKKYIEEDEDLWDIQKNSTNGEGNDSTSRKRKKTKKERVKTGEGQDGDSSEDEERSILKKTKKEKEVVHGSAASTSKARMESHNPKNTNEQGESRIGSQKISKREASRIWLASLKETPDVRGSGNPE